jgi:hypothetical protein
MSIKISQLRYAETPDYGWLPEPKLEDNNVHENDVLAAIRHILRDRSDCDQIPVVNGVRFASTPNEYGHNFFIDVTYAQRGYRATYGAVVDSKFHSLTCYMD